MTAAPGTRFESATCGEDADTQGQEVHPVSDYMPCPECGSSLAGGDLGGHECDPLQRADYQMFLLRHEIATFDKEFRRFLDGNRGRFATWLAARDVRRSLNS